MRIAFAAFAVLLAVAFGLREQLWQLIGGPADQGRVHFEYLTRTGKPNDFLLCPAGLCPVQADGAAPVFAASPQELLKAVLALVPEDVVGEEGYAFRYVARTPLMRFPDTVSVRIIPVGDERATLAIYSRSLIGYSDMGANRARVEALLQKLQASVTLAPLP